MEGTRRTDPQRMLKRKLRKQIEWGRWGLLAVIAATLLNQILLLCGAKYHLLFSAAMPYYLNWLAIQLNIGAFKAVATVLTIALYGAYAVCWLLSGHKKEWMLATLGLYGVDTLLLIIFAFTLVEHPASCLFEILVHFACLGLLGVAFRAFYQLSQLPRRKRPAMDALPEE